ncbi:MAG: glycosyltransferase, partial [Candidatus Rokubacteria bacterium]|nr:glycosyltransferase [Candidatus Rokubacteria bacterium]
MKISIALCCRDELGNLPVVLERLKWLDSVLKDDLWEVVIVDGGSTDGSREFLVEAAAAWRKLRVIDQQPP